MKITKILAREILDSRGNPTVETMAWSGDIAARAAVPSGASTGIHEAWELRDGDKNRYGGQGVLKACRNVNEIIQKAVKGLSANEQDKIDSLMLELDGTPNKKKLGANAILSVSLAVARLAAKLEKMELFAYLAAKYGYKAGRLPRPLFNVINGGKHADSGLDVQEFFLIPQKSTFRENLRLGAEVYHALKSQLARRDLAVSVGDEGGFAPRLHSNEEALRQLSRAIAAAGFKLGRDLALGLDAASSEFYDAKKKSYQLLSPKSAYKPGEIYRLYLGWIKKYGLQVVEDGCAEDDFAGWQKLTAELGGRAVLIGDDLFVTNSERLAQGVKLGLANALLVKVNQIGTLSETIAAVKLAQRHHYRIAVSHRSGETPDPFIADLAVAINADYIKSGAPCRGERLAKYNRLLEIEQQL
ncbi:MAG TPA: phosphopyruvate hydratase [Patescibacteria group bacterium]|nr:phosphopyruvate hydratase [Patescibacteria group bacterium]